MEKWQRPDPVLLSCAIVRVVSKMGGSQITPPTVVPHVMENHFLECNTFSEVTDSQTHKCMILG